MRKDYDIVGSYDNQRVLPLNAERTVNLFEYLDEHGKRPKVLLPTAGLIDAELALGEETGGARQSFVFNNAIYNVFGENVYKTTGTTGNLVTTQINTEPLATSIGYVGIDANQFQVIFVDGEKGWIYDTTTGFVDPWQQITDTGFPVKPIDVCYIDGFFIVISGGTNTFQLSSINQGLVWSGGTAKFTGSTSTNILTLTTSNANFQRGIPVTFTLGQGTSTFTASTITNLLTLETDNAAFQTGVPITFTQTQGIATFTGSSANSTLTLNSNAMKFETGSAITFSTSGTLPSPLVTSTTYYAIVVGTDADIPGIIRVATSYANAIANTFITLTTNGSTSGNTVTSVSTLPAPLTFGTTYFSIAVSSSSTVPGTIKVATTLANAMANIPITLTNNGSIGNSVNSTGVLPAPLNTTDTYYAILVGTTATNPGTIKIALTYADALAGTFITLTSNGVSLNTITVVGQLQLGSITSHPGTVVACSTLHRRIFFFSQNFTEVWENQGLGANLPIRRNNSSLMEVGTPAIASVSVGFDRLFFLAQDKDGLAGVVEVTGTQTVQVSNRALDFQLAQYASDPLTGVADARGILVKENGLIFYRLNFTLANHTFVLNVSMSLPDEPRWHEEEVLNGDRHPAQTHAYFDGVNYYGDYLLPLFYIVSDSTSNNNGEPIRRMRIGRQMTPEGYDRLRIDRFQLDLLQGAIADNDYEDINLLTEYGLIITTEEGQDIIARQDLVVDNSQPVVFLSISRDGGQSYGNELMANMGKIGERTFRTVWRKLGTTPRGQGFVPRIQFYNEIPFVILGAAWDYEEMPE